MSTKKKNSVANVIKLNLGCGASFLQGYTNLDPNTGTDARSLAQFKDESVDEVRASHLLEHFGHGETVKIVKEWARVLKVGGKLFISVPDIDKIFDAYEGKDMGGSVEAMLMGGQTDLNDFHKTIFNKGKLETILRLAGLVRVETWEGQHDTSQHPVSINLVGTKPRKRTESPKVAFVLSCPRLGFNDMWQSVVEAMKSVPGSILRKVTGAFWGQCLERGMMDAAVQGAEYIITLDYDSVFKASDVQELLYVAEGYPEADAIVPFQVARGWDAPLMTIQGADGNTRGEFQLKEFANPVIEIATGHFGMTLVRTKSLEGFPHPWFRSEPNADGLWEGAKIDDDIYFWKQWIATGRHVYMANRVSIGHMEPMIKWTSESLGCVHQSMSDYNKNGKPNHGIWK